MTTTEIHIKISELLAAWLNMDILEVDISDLTTYDDVGDYKDSIDQVHELTADISRYLDKLKDIYERQELVTGKD